MNALRLIKMHTALEYKVNMNTHNMGLYLGSIPDRAGLHGNEVGLAQSDSDT